MRIVFIGSGNVATHLSVALKKSGNEIIQVYSKTLKNTKLLASQIDAEPIDNIKSIKSNADLYIFSVKDDILPEIVDLMPDTDGIWAHTSGSVPMNLFSHKKSADYGVIYPLQTFSKSRRVEFHDIPIFIEGDNNHSQNILDDVAKSISGDVRLLDSDKRRYLHLAAVFANNFSNHMFTLASEILNSEGISFDVLKPLIKETAAKVMDMEPNKAQTGPAIRYDEKIIMKHLDLIKDTDTKEIYELISKSINKHSK
ncbi:MAG: DUF2520 domain-containing protein [Fermentimonas sp.]|nr:DUF2520 domain-containing protein [Fermentimonas sp.]